MVARKTPSDEWKGARGWGQSNGGLVVVGFVILARKEQHEVTSESQGGLSTTVNVADHWSTGRKSLS